MSFAHLHTHNEYSLLDGLGTAEQYILKAKELNQKYLALTNHGNVDGLIKFQKEADKQKINPVLGCEAYIVKSLYVKEKGEHRDHVTLLIQNEIGFQNLCKMLTKANLDGFYYKPRIDFELLYDHCEGLVILTGCSSSFLNIEGAEVFLSQLKKKLKDDIYLELMPHNFKEQKEHNKYCLKLSKKYKIDIVGTNDCHYINAEDEKTQQVLLAIQTQAKWNDENRFKFNTKGLFLCSEKQMASKFEHQGVLNKEQIEKCLSNTIEIAKKCSGFRIKKQGIFLPVVPKYKNENPKELLEQLVNEKLYTIFKKEKFTAEKRREYKSRVLLELDLIEKKGFIPYFLIIKELVDWCADNDIMIGCGRGSVGGCLVAYCLGITSIDSIKYNLLFSRFIADDRQDAPDIDIDFMDSKRELVRQHLEELYGKNNIASISTFLSMKGKAAIRDVARVFDLPLKEVDTFAKTISYYDDNSIEDACKTDEGKLFKKKYPEVITHALKLEGQIKANGSHAAAVIISADDLTQGTKGNLCKRSDTIVSNWDMEDSEYIGLMKLDVLGLSTLSVLDEVKKTVLENHGKKIIFDEIPLDDKKVYEQISAGNNVGVFQITAYSTNKLAQRLKADNIFLLSDLISLVRPGVADSGMTDLFLERKNGDEWEKKNDIFEEITKDTYGVLCIEENTKISLSSGIDIPINEVKKGDKLLSVNKDNKIESKICDGCAKTRIGNGYSITLSNNYSIILTGDHKVLTYYGMKEVSELSSNDLIASSYCLPSFVRRKKKNHIAYWLGNDIDVAYLIGQIIGDGGNGATICCGSEKSADILVEWIISTFNGKIIPRKYFRKSFYVCMTSNVLENNIKIYGNRKTKFHKFLDDFNLKETCLKKDISKKIMKMDLEIQSALLAGLMDSDGHISNNGVSFCSSSSTLLSSVRRLLQNLGIAHSFGKKDKSHIYIYGQDIMKERIEKYLKIKSFKNKDILNNGKSSSYVPKQEVIKKLKESNLSQNKFIKKYGIFKINKKYQFSEKRIADKIGIDNKDIVYYRIKEIRKVKNKTFYGLSVRDNHNLFGNGIIISNCYQEQVMELIYKMAGLSYSIADKIRKIISKKRDVKEFDQYKDMFIESCLSKEYINKQEAEDFWEMMLSYASYSFNHCLSGDEIIDKGNKNGRKELTIEEMYLIKNDKEYAKKTHHESLHDKYERIGYPNALSKNKENRLILNKIIDIRFSGIQSIYRVITESGKFIDCTLNHKFPTPDGEKQLRYLKEGNCLYVKQGYEICHNKYNFYDKDSPSNYPIKGQMGFQKNDNGNSVVYSRIKKEYKEAEKPCEVCGKEFSGRFELHHKDSNHVNNKIENFLWLCNSCHKNEHYKNNNRVKRYGKGLSTKVEKIKSIKFLKIGKTYDVEMTTPYHNLVTGKGIITSNSHALSYAIMAYYTAYLKFYFPVEFLCANLNYGSDSGKEGFIEEAYRLGLDVKLPIVSKSDMVKWKAKDGILYIPFVEIKGVGKKMVESFFDKKEVIKEEPIKKIRRGFFNVEVASKPKEIKKGKLENLLEKIAELKKENNYEELQKYFSFKIRR